MTRARKCFKCQKEITAGKYYRFRHGGKGGKRLTMAFDNEFFCPPCADEEIKTNFLGESLVKIEWEIGNQTDEEILQYEEKWQNRKLKEQIRDKNPNITLDLLKEDWQTLEPYLQKLDLVEKSFGGKIKGYGNPTMSIYYYFDKSAKEKNFLKEVVEKIVAEILGVEKLNQEINTIVKGGIPNDPSCLGRADGKLKVNDLSIYYNWLDSSPDIFRRLCLEIPDQKLALQALCRVLKIKEKELKGGLPEDNREDNNEPNPDKNNNNDNFSPPKPSNKKGDNNDKTENSPPNNYVLWISLSCGGLLLIGFIIWFFTKKKK